MYLDKENKPTGVVVEYYKENFLRHHASFADVTSSIFGDLDKEDEKKIITADPRAERGSANIFAALLESTLIKEAGSHLVAA